MKTSLVNLVQRLAVAITVVTISFTAPEGAKADACTVILEALSKPKVKRRMTPLTEQIIREIAQNKGATYSFMISFGGAVSFSKALEMVQSRAIKAHTVATEETIFFIWEVGYRDLDNLNWFLSHPFIRSVGASRHSLVN